MTSKEINLPLLMNLCTYKFYRPINLDFHYEIFTRKYYRISNFPLELRNELFDAEMSLLILCDHNRWRELEHLTDDYTRLEYRQQYSW